MTTFLKSLKNLVTEPRAVKALFYLICAAFGFKIFYAIQPQEFIILNVTNDDAYYYFKIASNIAHGLGSTFDGIAPTNGYHPLWMLVLVPIFKVFGRAPDILPVQASLVASVFFDALTTVAFFRVLKLLTANRLLAMAAAAVWTLTPFNLFQINNGLETTIAAFFLLVFLHRLIRALQDETRRNYLWLSVAAGFMMLSRTDYVLIAAAPFIAWAMRRDRTLKEYARSAAAYLAPATVMLLPWIAWNLKTFGTIVQTSGAAFARIQHELVESVNQHYHPVPRFLKAAFGKLAEGIPQLVAMTGNGIGYLFLGGAVWGMDRARRQGAADPKEAAKTHALLAFTIGVLVFTFTHVGVRWAFREWYFIPLATIVPILWVAYGLGKVFADAERTEAQKKGVRALVCLFLVSWVLHSTWYVWREFRPPEQTSHIPLMLGVEWIDRNVPEGEAVGAFNSGVLGYYATRTVINLDGLVNNAAYQAIKDHRVYEYASKDLGLRYLVENGHSITHKFEPVWGYDEREVAERLRLVETLYPAGQLGTRGINVYEFAKE